MIDSHFATRSSFGSGSILTLLPVLKSMGNILRTASGAGEKTKVDNFKRNERVKV